MFQRAKSYFLSLFVAAFYWLLSRTWRIEEGGVSKGPWEKSPKLYAHWHGDELLLVAVCIRRNMAIMASRSKDGELMTRVLRLFGFKVVRGSSTRGGAGGLKGLIDIMKTHQYHSSLAVDGPRGPIYKVKPGVLKLAQETGLPIIAGVAAASKRFVFKKSWNRCYLPLPFSKCFVVYGAPIQVPKDANAEELEGIRKKLETQLFQMKTEVESRFERQVEFPAGAQPVVLSGV